MLGDSNVGKSSFIERIIKNTFTFDIINGGFTQFFPINLNNSLLLIRFTDSYGQFRYRSFNEGFYRGAKGVILIYDITNKDSFNECIEYYNESINSLCMPNIKKLLIGNKYDLEKKRVITTKQGLEFASQNNFKFKEISCKQNKNIFEVFEELILDIFKENKELIKVEKLF
jgi:small GTP-binding protein